MIYLIQTAIGAFCVCAQYFVRGNIPVNVTTSISYDLVPTGIGNYLCFFKLLQEKAGGPLPKFGEWDVNDPASAEGFTVIFNKARDEKKTATTAPGSDSPSTKADPVYKDASYNTTGKSSSV